MPAPLEEIIADQLRSARHRNRSRRAGWIAGAILGVFAALMAFPPVRATLVSQIQFAFSYSGIPWVTAQDSKKALSELPRLETAVRTHPDDYLLQLGYATVVNNLDNVQRQRGSSLTEEHSNRSVALLASLARNFPTSTGSYAHLARYLTADRIRIQRIEIESTANSSHSLPDVPPARSIPPRRSDTRLMLWALRNGEIREPDNAFWPVMRSVTYYAVGNDIEALKALDQARRRHYWHAYIYEEILAEWRLYSSVYGDNGAAQKATPLSLVAFPHLREIRHLGMMARWQADQAARSGKADEAMRIRRSLVWLGILMRDTTQWAYEALFGTDLIFIATTPNDIHFTQSTIRSMADWEKQARPTLQWMDATRHSADVAWIRREAEANCALRQRVNIARYDSSFPGIPPGIPLRALFGAWIAGVLLLQQLMLLGLLSILMLFFYWLVEHDPTHRQREIMTRWVLPIILASTLSLLLLGEPGRMIGLLALSAVAVGLVTLLQLLWERFGSGKPYTLPVSAYRWTVSETFLVFVILILPALTALWLLGPTLCELHPIAVLLIGLSGNLHPPTPFDSLRLALLAGMIPLALPILCALLGLRRRLPPAEAVITGFRKCAPLMACLLFVAYLVALNSTLKLDSQASRAISEAAQNDLQWVLTHTETETAPSDDEP